MCARHECDNWYIGESARTLGKRLKEQFKVPSPSYKHQNVTVHPITVDNFSIVEREDQSLTRTIKESIYIRINGPSLNRNIDMYHLPNIWVEVMFNTQNLN